MQLCSTRMPKAGKKRIRRGKKMKNGSTSSTKNMPAVASLNMPGGRWAAYQASGVGSGWAREEKETAERFHQFGSPLSNLTTPDMNRNRNSNQRSSHTPGR